MSYKYKTKFMTQAMEETENCNLCNVKHTKFPHQLMEGIFSNDLSKNEIKVLLLLARLTYGCHREKAKLKKVDFTVTGIPISDIKEILEKLLEKNIITISQGENQHALISVNLEIESWKGKIHPRWSKRKYDWLIGTHIPKN